MYSYTFDQKTGGLLLNSTPTNFSKEPRPVYAQEMDLLGFDKYWDYDKQNDFPYMWAEANAYWYRGELIAKSKGGDLFHAPDLIPVVLEDKIPFSRELGETLVPIDIDGMNSRNHDLLHVIEESTVKKIIREYEKFKDKLDLFHVAFSGGKDSAVLLDLVSKALPKGSFVVIFGDTGMEFPDTYCVVDSTKKKCEQEGIPFYVARSHFEPNESWRIFGPPARVLRWCCSVHKSTPQTIKMREICGKSQYTGMDFVGVRKHESIARSTYEYENFGKKQKGQYSFNPILEWTSAEIWLYIYSNSIAINNAYKKGNSRAGCLFCPMSGGQSDYIRRCSYTDAIDNYISIIQQSYNASDNKTTQSYLINGGWGARNNGRDLKNNPSRYYEVLQNGILKISLVNPTSNWQEWIKTIGSFSIGEEDSYHVSFCNENVPFKVVSTPTGLDAFIGEEYIKKYPKLGKLFRQVFRKSGYCVACRVCETNCHNGSISFVDGQVRITNCIHCHQCHDIDDGCLLFHSLRHPQGGGKNMKSLNSFADHAPKREWLVSFFDLKEDFFSCHSLGPMMYDMFRRFLKDAGLNEKNHFTPFAQLISDIGWESVTALALIMINLAYDNPQIEWYVSNLDVDRYYERSRVEEMLTALDVKEKDAKSIVKAYKRIVETPFGTNLNFGYYYDDCLVRTKWTIEDSRVLLYALYRFKEKCNLDNEMHVSYLYNENIDRD